MAACSKVRPGVRVSEVIKLCKRLHITWTLRWKWCSKKQSHALKSKLSKLMNTNVEHSTWAGSK
jgi:hypothetical protein